MANENFRKASENFRMWLNALDSAADDTIPQVQDLLDGKIELPEDSPGKEQEAELYLRDISKKIDDVLSSFDKMRISIKMRPRYESYLDSL